MNTPVEVQTSTEPSSVTPAVNEGQSRRWRVGTLSMGLSLLFLGALIMASQWQGTDVFETALTWWPIVFILLGLEVVIYTLWFRGKGRMYYDVLSIFFVGILAICCLVFAGVSSLGLTQEIRSVVASEESYYELPEWKGVVPDGVTQVIVQGSEPYRVVVDQTEGTELSIFGNYVSNRGQLTKEQEGQLLKSKRVGNTLYIILGDTPRHSFDRSRSGLNVTVAVPSNLQVAVRDNYGNTVER